MRSGKRNDPAVSIEIGDKDLTPVNGSGPDIFIADTGYDAAALPRKS
jgi:hypothetical protein